MSNKQKYLESKSQALIQNIQVHEKELVLNRETLCTNPAVSFVHRYHNDEQKDFQSTQRIIETIYRQRGLRAISGSNNIFHQLHLLRNS